MTWPTPRARRISPKIHAFHGKSGHFGPDGVASISRSLHFHRNPRFSRKIRSFPGQTARPGARVHSISPEIHVFQSKSGHCRPDGVASTSRPLDFRRNPRFSGKIWSFPGQARWCGQHLVFTRFGPKSTFFSQNQVISWSDGDVTSRRRHVT